MSSRHDSPQDWAPRDHLALALDFDDLDQARGLARTLSPYFAVAKVGLELWSAAGPTALEALRGDGFQVFVDLKLHDIPHTVERAARLLARRGARYLTVHTAGGRAMLEAAVVGAAAGAEEAGFASPLVLGVTILTSEPEASDALLAERAGLAATAGCHGLVCAAGDLATVRRAAPGLCTVVPGIRPAGAGRDDQARTASPLAAIRAGADLLVVGRAVTATDHPAQAARALRDEVDAAHRS